MPRHLERSKRRLLSLTAWKIRLALWASAFLVGAAAVVFAVASEHANGLFSLAVNEAPWLALVICPLGLVLIKWMTQRWFPGAEGSGIPQTLAALEVEGRDRLHTGALSIKIALGKILMTLLGLLSGASIGREGPTVHIGAAIMYSVGRFVRFPPYYMERALILAGGAAGVAAAFNTPLAGVVFAIEELSRSFEEKTNGIVLTAVIFAGITALMLLGNYNYFGTTTASMTSSWDWLAIPVCGVIGGFLGGLFSHSLIWGSRRLKPIATAHPLKLAAACGLVVAVVGLLSGNLTYGTGYHEAKTIITEAETPSLAYPFLKMLASVASYLSGIPGGIFAPSLATGAGLGADLAHWFPHGSASVLIILGMVAYFTGVVQTPITAFVIVMEMTDNHSMLLPLMATAFIAHGVSHIVCPEPIYRALALAFLPGRNDRGPGTAASEERSMPEERQL